MAVAPVSTIALAVVLATVVSPSCEGAQNRVRAAAAMACRWIGWEEDLVVFDATTVMSSSTSS